VPLSLAGKGILICVTMNGETSDIELNFLVWIQQLKEILVKLWSWIAGYILEVLLCCNFALFPAKFFLQKKNIYQTFLYPSKGSYLGFPKQNSQILLPLSEFCAIAMFVIVACVNWHMSVPNLVKIDLLVQKLITHTNILTA
jgi:hypothetical protein